MTYLINGMLIHMDDTDGNIQEAVCLTLVTLAAVRPSLVQQSVSKVQHMHRSGNYTARVLDACKN